MPRPDRMFMFMLPVGLPHHLFIILQMHIQKMYSMTIGYGLGGILHSIHLMGHHRVPEEIPLRRRLG